MAICFDGMSNEFPRKYDGRYKWSGCLIRRRMMEDMTADYAISGFYQRFNLQVFSLRFHAKPLCSQESRPIPPGWHPPKMSEHYFSFRSDEKTCSDGNSAMDFSRWLRMSTINIPANVHLLWWSIEWVDAYVSFNCFIHLRRYANHCWMGL